MSAEIIPFIETVPDTVTVERDDAGLYRVGIRMACGRYRPGRPIQTEPLFFDADVKAHFLAERPEMEPLKIEYRFNDRLPEDGPTAA